MTPAEISRSIAGKVEPVEAGTREISAVLSGWILTIGEHIRHDYSRSRALYCKSVLHALRREWVRVKECATASIAVAAERGHGMMVAAAGIMLSAAQAMQQPNNKTAIEIRQAIAAYRATGTRIHSTHHLILLAQVLAECGQSVDGLAVLREAEALAEDTGESYVVAEIHRLEGNLLLARNGPVEAEVCYVRAQEVACGQKAHSLELRAATSLARLWADQGRRNQAVDLLAPIYGWFTEGFTTPDLKEAKTLWDELK